jgi:hypothetical protein
LSLANNTHPVNICQISKYEGKKRKEYENAMIVGDSRKFGNSSKNDAGGGLDEIKEVSQNQN